MTDALKELAKAAGLHASVVNRLEKFGRRPVSTTIRNLNAVIDTLEKAGVEIFEDGVRLIRKPRR
jgi:hypothetical protein